ncbi:MAG: FAD/NAD(P)-binding protein [Terricaulis sp.]|nr:FAD/NAD(P)-binding protein [Terricaulis sp.]
MAIGRLGKTGGNARRIAIIGGGFSGAAVAAALLRQGPRCPHIVLIEQEKRFGPGLAYGAAADGHLLNIQAANISARADAPDDFSHWLARGRRRDQSARFAPRRLYGAYLENMLHNAARQNRGALTRLRGKAESCRRENEHWRVTLACGRAVEAHAVVLAPGAPPARAPRPFAADDLIGAWDAKAQARIGDGDVLMLGTGLTMMDVATALARKRRHGVIYALSRRGLTPRDHAPAEDGAALDLPLELSAALALVRAQKDWRTAIDALRADTPALWARLGLARQQRFLRHLRPWWDVCRHRAAPETAARFAALAAEGRVRVLAGNVIAAERQGRHWRVRYRPRGERAAQSLDVAAAINCTGPDFSGAPQGLLRQVLEEGFARAPANGLGLEVDADMRVCDAAGQAQPDLYLIGPLALGMYWESTAVPELRAQAAAIAAALC